jgi:glycosyltransferase involved in cell wall biosynthesis
MEKFISVIIPNYNGSATIGRCIEAALASQYGTFEVVVVDDCSTDNSVAIITRYPCRLIRMDRRSGAGAARNRGAQNSNGELLFFTDADCLIQKDALGLANRAAAEQAGVVIGGTYTPLPADKDFFSAFQSLFIHYSETKKNEPDYIAGHAMVIDAGLFASSNGFREGNIPMPEDVAFSHQLRRAGIRLVMRPEIQVRHVFNFTLMRSLRNGFRKSMQWTAYSLANKDLFADSGTASVELKVNVACLLLSAPFAVVAFLRKEPCSCAAVACLLAFNLVVSRRQLALFLREKGFWFSLGASLYWAGGYALAVGAGVFAGMVKQVLRPRGTVQYHS